MPVTVENSAEQPLHTPVIVTMACVIDADPCRASLQKLQCITSYDVLISARQQLVLLAREAHSADDLTMYCMQGVKSYASTCIQSMSTKHKCCCIDCENTVRRGHQYEDFFSTPVCDVAGVQVEI